MAPDPASQAPQWYLSLNGKPTGPFTIDQLKMLVRDRQILPNNPVTAPHLKGAWVPVSTVVGAPQTPSAEKPTHASAGFQPPPRPEGSEPKNSPMQESRPVPQVDATDSLFDALQAAKERKSKAQTHEEDYLIRAPSAKISKKTLIVAGTLLLVTILAVAGINFFVPNGISNKIKTESAKNFGAVKPVSDPNFGPKNSPIKSMTAPPATPVVREIPKPANIPAGIASGANPRSITPPPPVAHDSAPIDSDRGNYRSDNHEEGVRNSYDNQGAQPPAYDPNYANPQGNYQQGGYPQQQYSNPGVQGGGYPNQGNNAPQQVQPGMDPNAAPPQNDPNMMQNAPPPAQFQQQPAYE